MGQASSVFIDYYLKIIQDVLDAYDARTAFSSFTFDYQNNGNPRISIPKDFYLQTGHLQMINTGEDVLTRLMEVEAVIDQFRLLETRLAAIKPITDKIKVGTYLIPTDPSNTRYPYVEFQNCDTVTDHGVGVTVDRDTVNDDPLLGHVEVKGNFNVTGKLISEVPTIPDESDWEDYFRVWIELINVDFD